MPTIEKSLVRLAIAICDEIADRSNQKRLVDLPVNAWEASSRIARQVRRAELHGWHLAAALLSTDLRYSLASLESQLADILRELPSSTVTESLVTTSDIYDDLVALGSLSR